MTRISDLKKEAVSPCIPEDDAYFHVYLYRNDHGLDRIGHTDFALGNTLISYGCHDPASRLPLCLKGDGVLIQADRKAFLTYHAYLAGELIIDYALRPSKEQMKAFLARSDTFFQHTIPWSPADLNDYASRLNRHIHPAFFKLRDHRYSQYDLLTNNCVTFVNDSIKDWLPGYHARIETPASFRHFLEDACKSHNPLFHSRTIWYQPVQKE